MAKQIRIGGAGGFYGDSSVAPRQLLNAGVDYIIMDYLAEATMSQLSQMKEKHSSLGYAVDLVDWIWKENMQLLKETGTKLVTNAGGLNPQACVARMKAMAEEAGLEFRIAVIDGDDLLPRIDEFISGGVKELYKGEAFPEKDQVATANAYLGAAPIAAALAAGADVVITGRVVDSALTLGPLMHEFGWKADEYDKLSAGSLAGHVIECGAQGSGGLFTDWEEVPDWAHIGYPIVECEADGAFTVCKAEGTGGLITPAVIAEQILYEVGDPQAYMLPDVVCDFTQLKLEETGTNRVRVTNAVGYAPSGYYKVSMTYKDGYRCIAFMPVLGRQAAQKATRQAEAIVIRVEEMLRDRQMGPFRATRIEAIGAEATYGENSRAQDVREVMTKLAVEHDDEKALSCFMREWDSPATSMSVGTTCWFGARAQITPVMKVFSFTIDTGDVIARVELDGKVLKIAGPSPMVPFHLVDVKRPEPGRVATLSGADKTVELIELAWARSGDKGDAFNVGVIARKPEYLPFIRAALSHEAVMKYFAHEYEGATNPALDIYELPGLNALNFHLRDALGGGQFASLRLDPLAKGKAQQLLDFPVKVPAGLLG
jgi:hypothetical protein